MLPPGWLKDYSAQKPTKDQTEEVPTVFDKMEEICECGTKAGKGQNHSLWCKLFVDEFL